MKHVQHLLTARRLARKRTDCSGCSVPLFFTAVSILAMLALVALVTIDFARVPEAGEMAEQNSHVSVETQNKNDQTPQTSNSRT